MLVILLAWVLMTVADLYALRAVDEEEEHGYRLIASVRAPARVRTPYRGPVDLQCDTEWDIPVAVDLSAIGTPSERVNCAGGIA